MRIDTFLVRLRSDGADVLSKVGTSRGCLLLLLLYVGLKRSLLQSAPIDQIVWISSVAGCEIARAYRLVIHGRALGLRTTLVQFANVDALEAEQSVDMLTGHVGAAILVVSASVWLHTLAVGADVISWT